MRILPQFSQTLPAPAAAGRPAGLEGVVPPAQQLSAPTPDAAVFGRGPLNVDSVFTTGWVTVEMDEPRLKNTDLHTLFSRLDRINTISVDTGVQDGEKVTVLTLAGLGRGRQRDSAAAVSRLVQKMAPGWGHTLHESLREHVPLRITIALAAEPERLREQLGHLSTQDTQIRLTSPNTKQNEVTLRRGRGNTLLVGTQHSAANEIPVTMAAGALSQFALAADVDAPDSDAPTEPTPIRPGTPQREGEMVALRFAGGRNGDVPVAVGGDRTPEPAGTGYDAVDAVLTEPLNPSDLVRLGQYLQTFIDRPGVTPASHTVPGALSLHDLTDALTLLVRFLNTTPDLPQEHQERDDLVNHMTSRLRYTLGLGDKVKDAAAARETLPEFKYKVLMHNAQAAHFITQANKTKGGQALYLRLTALAYPSSVGDRTTPLPGFLKDTKGVFSGDGYARVLILSTG